LLKDQVYDHNGDALWSAGREAQDYSRTGEEKALTSA